MRTRSALSLCVLLVAGFVASVGASARGEEPMGDQRTPKVTVKVVEGGESTAKPEDCRGVIVDPGVNRPDPFPGYGGFVGWESPARLCDGTWLVGFNASYWHASPPTPLRVPADVLNSWREMGMPADIDAPTGGHARQSCLLCAFPAFIVRKTKERHYICLPYFANGSLRAFGRQIVKPFFDLCPSCG